MQESNLYLAGLSEDCRKRLLAHAELVSLPRRSVLFRAGDHPRYAYFLRSGLASIVAETEEGRGAEVGMIGREGMVGVLQLLGPGPSPTQCFVQLDSTAARIPFREMQTAFDEVPEVRRRLLLCVQEQAMTLGRIAACHRLHEAEQRLSRWLLMAADRVHSNELHLTQEFLAEMLGAGRPTVSIIAGLLQRNGLIDYQRGTLRILNRPAMEKAACDCYQVVRQLYDALYLNNVVKVRPDAAANRDLPARGMNRLL